MIPSGYDRHRRGRPTFLGPYVAGRRPAGVAENTVKVFDATDLPAPDANGVITLTEPLYEVRGVVELASEWRINLNGNALIGFSPGNDGFAGDNPQAIIFSTAGGAMRNIRATNPGGPIFDLDDSDTTGTILLDNLVLLNSPSLGTISNCRDLTIDRLFLAGIETGWQLDGAIETVNISTILARSPVGGSYVGIDVLATATVGAALIERCFYALNTSGQIALRFADAATYTTSVRVLGNTINDGVAGTVPLSGVAKTDPRFLFSDNTGIVDSAYMGSMGYDANATQNTTISAQDTFVNIGTGNGSHPVFTLSGESERFAISGTLPDQELEYVGRETITAVAQYGVTTERIGSGTDEHLIQLVQVDAEDNETVLVDSQGSAEANAQAVSVSRSVPVTLEPGDRLRVQVANGTDTDNIRARSARLTVFRTR